MAQLLMDRLKDQGIDTLHVSNEKEIADALENGSFACVIIDSPSGKKNGNIMLLDDVRGKLKEAPILLLLDKTDDTLAKEALEHGASEVMAKEAIGVAEIVSMSVQLASGHLPAPTKEKKPLESEEKVKSTKDDGTDKPRDAFDVADADPKKIASLKKEIEDMVKKNESDISIIALVDSMMGYAYLTRASDLHLEPYEEHVVARMRVDGILHDVFKLPKEIQPGIISRIKVLGAMRTDEHQAAQDGRFRISMKDPERQFDVRVSIVPTFFGENAVLRLLAEQTQLSSLDDVALSDESRKKVRHAARTPYGMILATGPTGSGKTTTLYTILKELSTREVQIITIEDPVEYSIEGVDQIQVNNRTGLTFATGLRSILRQDPDIVLVGEIRDEETASIAINAALTGHKLLSTLHTNDAATTLPRLLDMGVEPFLVASTVNIAIGQRLLRMICQDCKESRRITEGEYKALQETIPSELLGDHRDFYVGKGCDICNGGGYKGRMGIYEILEMNDFIREAVMRHADAGEIKKIAVKNGMTTLLEDGFQKALDGLTTIEELLRVIHE